jgi:hypothetical protein
MNFYAGPKAIWATWADLGFLPIQPFTPFVIFPFARALCGMITGPFSTDFLYIAVVG